MTNLGEFTDEDGGVYVLKGVKTESEAKKIVRKMTSSEVSPTKNSEEEDEFLEQVGEGILTPYYDPELLSELIDQSPILGPAIRAMVVNVDSFGYELVPSTSEKEFDELKKDPTINAEIEREKAELKTFFKYANRKLTFDQIRSRTRIDYESHGNGYWEILRNNVTKRITGIEWIPSSSIRACKMDKRWTDVKVKRKISATVIKSFPDKNLFRPYVQIIETGSKPIWFKEFGDPRLMDSETGAYAIEKRNDKGDITDVIPLKMDGKEFNVDKFLSGKMRLATEVLHIIQFNDSARLPYGTPRWLGCLPEIKGSRSAAETNNSYFENKTVPPGILMVAGGNLRSGSADRIRDHIQDNVKGKDNYHSILVIEANNEKRNVNEADPKVPTVTYQNLTESHQKEGLFQEYDQKNISKVIGTFRFWEGYVGRTKEINKATAEVAREISEEQVFRPERTDFDAYINRTLLVEMGINYWEFHSRGAQLASPTTLSTVLKETGKFLTIKEARMVASEIHGRDLNQIDEEWTRKPLAVILAEITKRIKEEDPDGQDPERTGVQKSLEKLSEDLESLAVDLIRNDTPDEIMEGH